MMTQGLKSKFVEWRERPFQEPSGRIHLRPRPHLQTTLLLPPQRPSGSKAESYKTLVPGMAFPTHQERGQLPGGISC